MAEQNVFQEFIDKYGPAAGADGPVRFVREVLGAEPDEWQKEVLMAWGRAERRIAVKSCHGVGKTACAAWCIVYNLCCRFPQKVVATAPASGQLQGALVPEVKKWILRTAQNVQDLLDIKADSIYLKARPSESYFEARTSRAENPDALQGVHCEGGFTGLVCDEASGIPEQVYESAGGSMSGSGATTLLIGNPVRATGYFHSCFHKMKSIWRLITVSHETSPRVTDDFVMQTAAAYGRNSNAFRVRALGEFPLSDEDTVIPFDWVAAATMRDIQPQNDPEVWGLDVARFGLDKTALVKRSARAVTHVAWWGASDLMDTVGRVKREYDDADKKPRAIYVDVIGLGGGVVDRLKEFGMPVRAVNVSELAALRDDCHRLRDELWWDAREWFQSKDCTIPPATKDADPNEDPYAMLANELTQPRYSFRSNGKKEVEGKDDMKKRKLPSPNVADAFCLTFAGEGSILAHGSQAGFSWDEPLDREIVVV